MERTQTIALRPGSIQSTAGATISGQDIVLSSGGLGAMTLTLARLGTDGELQWQSALAIPESRWQRPLVLGDEVVVLADGAAVTLHFVDRRGSPRREITLGETSALWYDGCLLPAGDRLFAAWVGDANYDDGQDRGTVLRTAWISVATGEVLRERTQRAAELGHQLACARRDADMAVLVLDARGTIHSTIMGAESEFDRPLIVVAKLDSTYDFWRPQLVADGDGFAAAWDAVRREDDRMPPRGFVSYLDRGGRRTRIVELGFGARDVQLIPGSSGVTAVYWSGGQRLSTAEVRCGGVGHRGGGRMTGEIQDDLGLVYGARLSSLGWASNDLRAGVHARPRGGARPGAAQSAGALCAADDASPPEVLQSCAASWRIISNHAYAACRAGHHADGARLPGHDALARRRVGGGSRRE